MALLDIRPGEGRKFSLLLVHSFCNGIALSSLISAAPTLFLRHFGAGTLPWCYIATAAVLPALGYAHMRLAGKISLPGLLRANLIFVLGGLLALRLLLLFGFDRLASAAMVTWVDVQVFLLALEFDALTGSVFDLRQSKRIFPTIGSGDVVAGILGGLCVPLITPKIGVENLLWIAIAGVAGAFFILQCIIPSLAVAESVSLHQPASRKSSKRLGPLALALIVTAALADLSSYFGDNIYYTRLSKQFSNPEEMASFIGYYTAVAGGLALMIRLTLTPFIYRRLGITAGLVVGPVITCGLAITLCLLMGGFISGEVILFWSAAGLKLNDDVHRKSNHRTGLFLLLQALPIGDRIRTQTIQEGMVGSLIGGVAGGLLLLMNKWSPLAAPWTLGLFALGWAMWVLKVRQPYVDTLAGSLRRQLVVSEEGQIVDATSRQLLQSYLSGSDPALILYAMHQLGPSDIPGDDLEKLLGHPTPEIRVEAVQVCRQLRDPRHLPALEARIRCEEDRGVVGEMISAAAALSPEGVRLARDYFHSIELDLRRHALAGVLRQNKTDAEALAVVVAMIASPEPAERVAAGKVIAESESPALALAAMALLGDSCAEVRRQAIRATGPFQAPGAIDALVPLLGDVECQPDVIAVLKKCGADATTAVLRAWELSTPGANAKRGMIRALEQIHHPDGLRFLWSRLAGSDLQERTMILDCLAARTSQSLDLEQRKILRALFLEEAANATLAAKFQRLLPVVSREQGALDLARASVVEDAERSMRRALDVLGMLYTHNAFLIAKPYLVHVGQQTNVALETVENILSPEDWLILVPAVASFHGAGSLPGLPPDDTKTTRLLSDLPISEAAWLSLFTQFLTIRWLAVANDAGVAASLKHRQSQIISELGSAHGALPGFEHVQMEDFYQHLALFHSTAFFHSVSLPSLLQIVRRARRREFQTGAPIFQAGEQGNSLFVIVRGRAEIRREIQTPVEVGPGGIFGEVSAIEAAPRLATATARESVVALEVGGEMLHDLMRRHFDISKAMLRLMAHQLRNANQQHYI